MSNDMVTLAPQKRRSKLTHWPGCETVHLECLLVKVSDKARALQDEVERLKAMIVSLSRPLHDGSALVLDDDENRAIMDIWQEAQHRQLREMAGDLDAESEELRVMRAELLAHCASMADEVEATAQTWGGREAAAEIGKRIRSLMEAGR